MKARVMGYNEFENDTFSYELLNVVCVLQVGDIITIQYVDNAGMLKSTAYQKNNVKIVFEN